MEFIQKNSMSAVNFARMQGAPISCFPAKKAGKFFFVCGEVSGYTSSQAAAILNDSNLSDAEALGQLKFAEVSSDEGATYIPCLMVAVSKKALSTRGASLLGTL